LGVWMSGSLSYAEWTACMYEGRVNKGAVEVGGFFTAGLIGSNSLDK